jgi:FHA domain
MAAVTYQCPVDPTRCSPSAHGGFCPVHMGARLERIRPRPAVPDAGLGQGPAPGLGTAAGLGAEPGGTGRLGVRILDQILIVPPDGLLLGREAPATRDLAGFAGLIHVGRQHARLFWHDGGLYAVDLGSQNHTFFNNQPITEPVRLGPGQTLDLAGDVSVVVVELDDLGLPK